MTDVHIPVEDRPFIGKYIAGAFFGFCFIGAFVWLMVRSFDSTVITFGVVLFAVLAQTAIVFLMVESLIKDWFAVAEIINKETN